MAIQYYMRGYNIAAPGTVGYVDWVVDNTPDTTATYVPSPYVSGNITNIIVNRAVTSKVDNFLNPAVQPTFVSPNYPYSTDKYLLHLNSYDWLNPNPPDLTESLPPANQPIGIAIVRGTSNGTTLNPYSSLFWDETTSQWSFAQITNGTIGSSQGLAFGNGFVDGYLLVDGYLAVSNVSIPITDWASTGLIRLPNAQSIQAKSSSSGNIVLVASDSNNNVLLGDATHNVIIGGTAANTIGNPTNFQITIAGNLLVLGNTTTVESTTVDIVGRVIHANWSTSNNPAVPPPSMIAGYSVHRGAQLNATAQNDGAAWIWTEGSLISGADGYWRAATIPGDGYGTDGYTIANSPNILSVMAKDFTAASTPNPALGTLPGVGGLRTQNNTTAVSAINAASTQNLLLLGSDVTNHVVLGESTSPQNAGLRLYTTTGSFTDFFVNSVSEVQIASDTNGPFVRESSTTFVPATSAFIRVPNNTLAVAARNAANTQDLVMLSSDAANHIVMGNTASPQNAGFIFNTTTASVFDYQTASVSEVQLGSDTNGPFVRESASTFIPAVSGFVRVPNNGTAVAARNAGNTTDILLVGTDSLNRILHGDSVSPTNAGHVFSTTTNSVFDFWVNGQSQVQILQDNIVFTNTDGYAAISQAPTYYSSVTGAPFTIAAQSVFGSNGIGGNLILSSGFGSLIDGYVDLQISGITVAAVEPNKFTFVQGRRRHITQVTGTYNVSLTDDFIAITTLTAPFSIFLPTFPALGDAYEIKDTTGNAGTSNVTVNGNGTNIDGSSSFALAQPYAAATFTFTGTTWSVT